MSLLPEEAAIMFTEGYRAGLNTAATLADDMARYMSLKTRQANEHKRSDIADARLMGREVAEDLAKAIREAMPAKGTP